MEILRLSESGQRRYVVFVPSSRTNVCSRISAQHSLSSQFKVLDIFSHHNSEGSDGEAKYARPENAVEVSCNGVVALEEFSS